MAWNPSVEKHGAGSQSCQRRVFFSLGWSQYNARACEDLTWIYYNVFRSLTKSRFQVSRRNWTYLYRQFTVLSLVTDVLFWKGGFSTLPGQASIFVFWLSIPSQSLVGPDSNILQACFPLWSHKHHKCSGALCDLGSLLDDEAWPVRLPAPHALFDSTHSKLRRTCTEFEFCQMPK